MDRIFIDGLEVFANHGVLAEEKSLGQKFIVSVEMFLDTTMAGYLDDLNQTINYAKVCEFINTYMKENTFKLIETVANRLGNELLVAYDNIQMINVTVKKPWAPIGYPLECVSVSASRQWHTVYLSIGSNMGDKEKYLDYAVNALEGNRYMKDICVSKYLVTKPYGMTEQDDFVNAAIKVKTVYSPYEMLYVINGIEREAGRKRTIHWGPRTLDIDILFYDDVVMDDEKLTIPHADLHNREFVLAPLCELSPNLVHPVNNMTVSQMLDVVRN